MASGGTGSEEAVAAALELTFVSIDGVNSAAAEEKRCYAVAWLEPGLKQRVRAGRSRKATPRRVYFPLPRRTMDDVSSCVTIEIIYSRAFHFTALVLPLRTPSGRVRGAVMVSARILWDLGFDAGAGGFPATESDLAEIDLSGPPPLQPTAPPLAEDNHVSDQGDHSWAKLAAGASAAAAAVILGVAFRRLNA
ncbi:unnamed protein product [Spirodela intermedia]|uniref:Uncharacterized protein n=1 Tax=Spirodela intermedia TaxID=51605 RepID=A0A7I8ID89_SPIIN|nr:unnamed protein product [Spirodela intermedia]CAA6655581.1 unnamed protein product [Spirodela intermedia]